ncbi:helical backbone metal receptor [[Actinobacillus] muris]|uniref:Helical backbone metal receptor n=1 Tax=Muribacter muris TaxID=67855 RepID=A0A0J5S691_9PAST|nr:helical backbone metal receptor [Muribacter muris]KMK52382.1 helical backbone metal receptor [[Actinobacillus] muris] [Muribacter muris]
MMKYLYLLPLLLLSVTDGRAEQFVSLTLCSDRLLIEIARSEQIAAMSAYSKKPLMMLDKVNTDKPALEAQLTALLPYLDKTILLNTQFYPQLTADLTRLGVKIIPINDSPQTPEQLFALIRQLGELTDNTAHAERLISQLTLQDFALNSPLTDTLVISETGVADTNQPPYRTLLNLLGLTPLNSDLPVQDLSLEKILLSQPNWLISLTDKQTYNAQSALLTHSALQKIFANRPLATLPMKYIYCFDHGIWQGAERLYRQMK